MADSEGTALGASTTYPNSLEGMKQVSRRIEAQLLKAVELYCRILSWTDHNARYLEPVDYFPDGILGTYRAAIDRFRRKGLLSSHLDETVKRLLVRAKREKRWFTVAEAGRWTEGRGAERVRRHLNGHVAVGGLEAQGRTRSERYRFARVA